MMADLTEQLRNDRNEYVRLRKRASLVAMGHPDTNLGNAMAEQVPYSGWRYCQYRRGDQRKRSLRDRAPERGWIFYQISESMSVGLITRTEIGRIPCKELLFACKRERRPNVDGALACAPTWPLWPGGPRHVQRGNP
jgi:hypothetical protein